jgi:hypothetical protein
MSDVAFIKIVNTTGKTIISGGVTHVTQDYGSQTIKLSNLADGAETSVREMITGPSSKDYWYIWWTNDGENYVTFDGTNAIHGHSNIHDPGQIKLRGLLGNSALAVWFYTDGSSEDKKTITNPW